MRRGKSFLCLVAALVIVLAGSTTTMGKLPEGLVFLMTFDEGSGDTVKDLSGFGNNGTVKRNAGWVEGQKDWIVGKFRGGFHFDGMTYITVKNAKPLSDLTHPMSVGAWVNPDVLGGWRNIVEMDAEGMGGWKMGFHDSRAIVWTTYRVLDFISQTPIETGKWTYVVATWDGAKAIVYVNGKPDAPMAGGGVIDTKILPSLDIGRRRTSNASYYAGGMDELFIFKRVLDQNEINKFMQGFGDIVAVEPGGKLAATWGSLKSSR